MINIYRISRDCVPAELLRAASGDLIAIDNEAVYVRR